MYMLLMREITKKERNCDDNNNNSITLIQEIVAILISDQMRSCLQDGTLVSIGYKHKSL